MKKIAVVVPPIKDFYYTPHRGAFLGARYVANFFKKRGYEAEVFDFPNKKQKETKLPQVLDYLKPHIENGKKDSLFFKSYKRFGYSFQKCTEILKEFSPDAIVFSLFAFAYAQEFLDFASFTKKEFEKIPLFAGGSGVSCFPEYFFKTGLFNAVFTGEIEALNDKAIDAIQGKLNGIVKTDSFSEDKDIDFLLAKTKETKTKTFYSSVLSRGCPKNCAFCSNFIVQGKKFRTVAIEKIEEKIKNTDLKNANINFEDDNILLDKEYLVEVLSMIKKRFPDTTFTFENGIDYTFLDVATVEKLINLGVKQFNLSIGHISKEILSKNKRPANIEKLVETLRVLKKKKVLSIVYFITGLKNDSFRKTLETMEFLKKLPCLIGISPFYPVPGIAGFEDREIFEKKSPILTKGSSFYPWNKSLTTEEMVKAFRIARKTNIQKRNYWEE